MAIAHPGPSPPGSAGPVDPIEDKYCTSAGQVWLRSGVRPLPDSTLTPSSNCNIASNNIASWSRSLSSEPNGLGTWSIKTTGDISTSCNSVSGSERHRVQGAFQEGQEDWTCYCERLEQFFQANGIDDEGKRRAVLLSVCGGPVYQLIRNLAAPGKPSDKSFSELERDGESVSQFVAELHKLSEHCDFENSLEDMLRDVRVQRRLLAEAGLTFAKAFGLAQTSELAEKNFQDLQHSEGTPVHPEHKGEPAGRPWSGNCSRCGGKHKASDCRCKSLVCYKCGKQGHWLYDTIPLNEQSGKTPMDGDKTETYALYNLSSSKSRMPLVQLLMREYLQACLAPVKTSGLGELRTYTVPYALRDIVEQELERLQRDGVIEPVRFSELMGRCGIPVCCNFGFLSPSPNSIDDVLASMTGAKVFSKLDLSHAYLLEEESKEFVTISTHKGLFRYNLLPFGVAAAPAIFQRTMEGIFPTFRHLGTIVQMTAYPEKAHT
eukprot:Em0010g271a